MPIFQDPPLPVHAPTPTAVPGRVRLAFRMHANDDTTRVRVTYRAGDDDVRFDEPGRPPSRTVVRQHVIGRFAEPIVLDVALVWSGAPAPRNVSVDGTVVEEATGDTIQPTWTLTVMPTAHDHGAAELFAALTNAAGGAA